MSTWALVGSPNSGKTTLYNWLTGARSKVVNYPGATVEYSVGPLRKQLQEQVLNLNLSFIDTPGIYSLAAQSEDERVTHATLFNTPAAIGKIKGVIAVVDGTQLNRHLVLAEELKESGYPLIIVVTMADLLQKDQFQVKVDDLKNYFKCPVFIFNGLLGAGLFELLNEIKKMDSQISAPRSPNWDLTRKQRSLVEMKHLSNMARTTDDLRSSDFVDRLSLKQTKKIDDVLLHPVFGFVTFLFFMTILFSSVYWLATPMMDLIDQVFGFLAAKIVENIPGLLGQFIGEGLIAAIGGVAVFVPQIFILFLGIGLLESTGYLARVACLIDRPLSKIGLGGRSFVPLLSGFACAIPALMATRNISSKKEKFLAQCIIPFMTCSARLPVFALLISFLFIDRSPVLAGLTMASLYFVSLFVGAVASGILSRFIDAQSKPRLMMELPLYRWPRLRILFLQAAAKSKSFLFRAGPIILGLALVLWFATNFPQNHSTPMTSKAEIAQHSYAAQLGQIVEPIFKPLGLDWRGGFGLISAFAAREVFVSSLALMYNVDADGQAQTDGLLKAMREAHFADGEVIFKVSTVVGLFLFFIIALQCISTFALLKKESGSWRMATAQLVLSNLLAYAVAVVAVQSLKSFGW